MSSVAHADATLDEQFWRDGYVLFSEVVPPDQLGPLRSSVEKLIARRRSKDLEWDTCPTPRADLTEYVDQGTLEPLELALHDNTLGVSTRLLGCHPDEVSLTAIQVLCQPEFEPDAPPASGQS